MIFFILSTSGIFPFNISLLSLINTGTDILATFRSDTTSSFTYFTFIFFKIFSMNSQLLQKGSSRDNNIRPSFGISLNIFSFFLKQIFLPFQHQIFIFFTAYKETVCFYPYFVLYSFACF